MLKKTITYTDYDGNERTEDFYFNLTKAECIKLQFGTTGGLEKLIRKIIAEQDTAKVLPIFEEIVLSAYGEKSMDGRRFIKSPEISEGFKQTEAYSQLFMELMTDSDAATEFINGIVPEPVNPEEAKAAVNAALPTSK